MAIATMRVPTIFTAVDKFSDVVSKMTRKTTAFEATAQAAAMRTSRSFNSAGNKMLGAGVAIGAGLGYAVNEAMTFEDKLSNLNTILNATPQELENIKQTIFDVAKSTGVPLDDLASQFYELASAQIKGVDASNALNYAAKLSVAGIGTMQQATEVMIGSLNGFRGEGLKANEVFEDIAKTVQNGKLKINDMSQSFAKNAVLFGLAGGKYKEYLAATSAMTTTTMPASEVQNALGLASMSFMKMGSKLKKGLSSSGIGMSDYTKKQNELQKVILPLGARSGTDLIKLKGGVVPAIVAIAKQAKKMGIELATIFPRQGALAAASLLAGAALKDESKIMGLLADNTTKVGEAMLRAKENTQIKWNRLKNEAKILAITIGDSLLPRIKDMAESASKMVGGLASWAEKNKGFATTLMTVAKWLLILGVVAKVGAFLFYGLAQGMAFVAWVGKTYEAVTLGISAAQAVASLTGESLLGVMWSMVTAEVALLAPALAIVAVLGLLTYAMVSSIDSTDMMVNKQVSALSRNNDAWINSTGIMAKELKKQKGLTEFNTPQNISTQKIVSGSILGNIAQRKSDKQAEIAKLPPLKPFTGNLFNANKTPVTVPSTSTDSAPKNLAGESNSNMKDIQEFIKSKSGDLNLNITAPEGYKVDVDGTPPKGINPVITPNQGKR